jgi:hypothetical protein
MPPVSANTRLLNSKNRRTSFFPLDALDHKRRCKGGGENKAISSSRAKRGDPVLCHREKSVAIPVLFFWIASLEVRNDDITTASPDVRNDDDKAISSSRAKRGDPVLYFWFASLEVRNDDSTTLHPKFAMTTTKPSRHREAKRGDPVLFFWSASAPFPRIVLR